MLSLQGETRLHLLNAVLPEPWPNNLAILYSPCQSKDPGLPDEPVYCLSTVCISAGYPPILPWTAGEGADCNHVTYMRKDYFPASDFGSYQQVNVHCGVV